MARRGADQSDDGPLREAALEQLVAEPGRPACNGRSCGPARFAAASLGVGKRTLWRWIAAGRSPKRYGSSPRRFVLTPELRDVYLRLGGNVAAVWREARERGLEPPPLWTLQAAFARELSPAEHASARRGEAGRREQAALALGINVDPATPYAPHEKGKIERPHRSLGGHTPLERWAADPTPLRFVEPEDARRLLTARRWARVRRDGVHHGGRPTPLLS